MHNLVNCDKCGEAHKPEYTMTMNYKAYKIKYKLCTKCFEQQLTFIGQYYESGLKPLM
jgi:formylmethanofuran dehydrogenase subunit E